MPANLYASLADFQQRFLNNATIDAPDVHSIELCLANASRRTDDFCHRPFYAMQDSRVYDGTRSHPDAGAYRVEALLIRLQYSMDYLWIDDLLSATQVAFDENSDRIFELVLDASKDYYLVNYGAPSVDTPPYNRLQLDTYNGIRATFPARPRVVQIIGTWGYTNATTPDSGTTATLADAVTTAMTTNQAGALSRGQTLLLGVEQVYVTGGSGTAWTVTRAMNGTTAAAHAAVAVSRYSYLSEVSESCLIMAARLYERRKSMFQGTIVNPAIGTIELVPRGIDPDVFEILAPYVRRFV